MKKFYALALGVCCAMAANAETVVSLAGGYNSWSSTANPMTETSTGVYETEIPELLNEFKVVITTDGEAAWYGSNDALEVGKSVVVAAGDDFGNIKYANDVLSVVNAKVKFEMATMTLSVSGETGNIELAYGIHGSFATGEWATTNMTENADGLWEVTFTGLTPMATPGQFGIKVMNAATGDQMSWVAAAVADVVIDDETEEMELTDTNTSNISVSLTGNWTFIYEPKEMLLSVVKAAGIADVAVEAEGAAEYFNLQGVRVNEPAAGLYLVRKAGKVEKVIVK